MRWYKIAVYSAELVMLRDYLKHGLDPYDFAEYLDEYFEEVGYPQGFVDAEQYLDQMGDEEVEPFKDWLEKERIAERMVSDDPALAPSYLYMDYSEVVPPQTWLVHFSDEASAIGSEGFQKGHDDVRTLGLTTVFDKKSPGWNFGLVADSKEAEVAANSGKYGKHAVIFMSAGVQAYHHGDKENQVIFQGPGVKEAIPIYNVDGEWAVESTRDGREIFRGKFGDVVNWVQTNYAQYRKVLV